MRALSFALSVSLWLAMLASPAEAAALLAAIGAFFTSGTIVAQVVGRILVSVAASALMQALAPKPRPPGIRTEVTQNGGTNPCAFVLMTYATAGQRVCPPMSHGSVGKTPNAYLTEVIELGDIPGQELLRVMVNDEYVTLGPTPHPDYGFPVQGDLAGFCWVKYYDGTQTAADPMLLAKYGTYPERPWTSEMIGRGICYAIVTCRFSRKRWNAMPRFRFEMAGIPLYDPRKDTTVGGSGTQRWNDTATWQPSTNPVVGIYNILRGIALQDGSVWGGGFPAADLPLSNWFAAMNECDVLVDNGAGGTERQYRAGFEVNVDDEPADIIAELLKACSGQMTEVAGTWKIRVGAPGLPVLTISDDDVVITSARDLTPFPGFTASYNGVHATYPEPGMLWEPKEAPPLYNATWEAEDQGQRLIADLGMPAVPYGAQVRRLMDSYIREERRFRRHGQTLPPDAVILEPLDSLAWTSSANGYSGKVFEIAEVADDLYTCLQTVALRERDPADYVSTAPAAPEFPSPVVVLPAPQDVPNFAVTGVSITDATSAPRRPALKLTWEPDLDDVRGILWEVRLQATGTQVASGSTQNVAAGELLVSEGILASTTYEVRAQPVADRPVAWTAWVLATTPATLITSADVAEGAVTAEVKDVVTAGQMFSTLPVGTILATINLPNPNVPWQINAFFDIRRTNGSGGTFTVVLEEKRVKTPLNDIFRPLQTWTIMTDGEPGNIVNWWPRWFTISRGGLWSAVTYQLRVSVNTGSPFGEIRNINLVATRVTK